MELALSKVLLDLEDFIITDSGGVLFKHDAIVDLLRRGQSIENIVALEHDDVTFSNRRHPEKVIKTATITGVAEELPEQCYKFLLPDSYLEIDLSEYLAKKLVEQDLYLDTPYIKRVALELEMMCERGMEDFIRTMIYMVDVFEQNGVVHGVGRGSSCSSLVLYLIGVHMVDPVVFNLNITEFLR